VKKLLSKVRLLMVPVAAFLLIAFLALPAAAQDADDDFDNADPCRGDPQNPVIFEFYPRQAPPGGIFLITGKPHDPRTVGPGSDVSFNWQADPSYKMYSAEVDAQGWFLGTIKVPEAFSPGKYVLQYAEASPFTTCVEFTVIEAQEGAPAQAIPGLGILRDFLRLLMRLIGAV
jgi:hypothetical protein